MYGSNERTVRVKRNFYTNGFINRDEFFVSYLLDRQFYRKMINRRLFVRCHLKYRIGFLFVEDGSK